MFRSLVPNTGNAKQLRALNQLTEMSQSKSITVFPKLLSFCVHTRQQHNVVTVPFTVRVAQLVVSVLVSTLTSHASLETDQSQTHLPSQRAQHTCDTWLTEFRNTWNAMKNDVQGSGFLEVSLAGLHHYVFSYFEKNCHRGLKDDQI